ncbi:HipA domain-containing protein [Haemophilus influenzae]|uniref:type II toxin-antitoxin system HipA family toxin n=1 Tax=Haemophilus influenzae TaxID=727 RepID=UPI000938AD57|nr:HipA domain-containing protein [Haemophilus influenzae]MCK9021704.1 HipA domain-containing protein [Haemophilus influenzae]OKQ01180.1 kinase [Haemophilus influenzae]
MNFCRILLKPLKKNEALSGYSAEGLHYLTGNKHFNPELPFSRQEFITVKPQKQQGMSISGFQPKLQLIIKDEHFDSVNQQGNYILKPSPEEYPFLAENEHATMHIMKELGFDVPENGLVSFAGEQNHKEFAFVIKRFDRDEQQKPMHQEQLDGAMNIRDKYGKIGADNEQYVSYERVAKFILQHTENHLAQQREIFRRIIYAYLLGNNDLHLRNFSFIYPKNSHPKLAPIYDFVSVSPYPEIFNSTLLALPLLAREEGNATLAKGFNTQYGEYIGDDFVEFGENIGLNKNVIIQKLIPEIIQEKEKVEQIYSQSFMPQPHIDYVLKTYRKRLALLNVLNEPEL